MEVDGVILTGLKRAREMVPDYMEDLDYNRDMQNGGARTMRRLTRALAADYYPDGPFGHHWITEGPFGHHNEQATGINYTYEPTLNIMAVTRIRMIWQRFMLNLRKSITYRRSGHGLHSASIMGAW